MRMRNHHSTQNQNHLHQSFKMDNDWKPLVNEILSLTLEILYLLTGENYIAFKLSDGWVAQNVRKPNVELPPPSTTLEKNNDQKILEVTQKMIELLGEVPMRCQDVTVSLEVENTKSSGGHQELYNKVVVENYPTLNFHDVFYSPGTPGGLPTTIGSSIGQVNETGYIVTVSRQDVPPAVEVDIRACTKGCVDQVQDGNAVTNIYNDHGYMAVYSKEVLVSMENDNFTTINAPAEDKAYISDEVTEISVTCDEESTNTIYVPQHPLSTEENSNLKDEVFLLAKDVKIKGKRPANSKVEDNPCQKPMKAPQSFSCSQCCKRFSSRSLLTRHERIHTGLKPYACLECNRCFNRVENLAAHIRIHKGEKPFSCPCGRVFLRKESLLLHKRTHSGEKPFSCTDCQRSFTNRSDLVRHRRIHLSQKPFLCSECGKLFTNKWELVRHQKTHQDKILPCPQCKRHFTGQSELSRHLQRHQISHLKFTCPECDKHFLSKSELTRHKVTHSGEKPFECSECGKHFNRAYNLDSHKKTHLGEKPFVCAECGKRFLRKSQLTLHERTHTGEKPYSCSECAKRFTSSSDLVKHHRLHTGEKPYACDRCHRRFTHKPDLTKHQRVHSKEAIFRCPRCEECFFDTSTLLRHQKTHGHERPVCGGLFSSNIVLADHQRTQSVDASFLCSD